RGPRLRGRVRDVRCRDADRLPALRDDVPAPAQGHACACGRIVSDPTPRFTGAAAERIAQDCFGVEATAAPLPSERDQNFVLITAGGEKRVLKIAKADEDRAVLEAQNAALAHVARRL